MFPCFWGFLALGWLHIHQPTSRTPTTKETKSLRNDRCKNNFILNLLTRLFKHPLIKASLIQPIFCLFMNSEGWPINLRMTNQWDRRAYFNFSSSFQRCCVCQECLNKWAGKGNCNSREHEEGQGGIITVSCSGWQDYLSLDPPPAFTSKHLKARVPQPCVSILWWRHNQVLSYPTDKTCISHCYPTRKKLGESDQSNHG